VQLPGQEAARRRTALARQWRSRTDLITPGDDT